MSAPATVFALTPVLNEAWILDAYLACASTWADHIIIADQGSDDSSREIASTYPKVVLVGNNASEYDEGGRQRLLIETARSIPVEGRRILIALDSDEFLTANRASSPEWQAVLNADPGTVVWFDWVNVAPGGERFWQDPGKVPFGFVDDGRPHVGERIHSRRIPTPPDAPALHLDEVKVLHYQCIDWPRMRSKQRWYQAWERLNHPGKRPITLFRQYHHMDAGVARAQPMPREWTEGYEREGHAMPAGGTSPPYRWDHDVLDLLQRHGTEPFRRLDVWDIDWTALNGRLPRATDNDLRDPRSDLERRVLRWLARTQAASGTLPVRAVQRVLQFAGW